MDRAHRAIVRIHGLAVIGLISAGFGCASGPTAHHDHGAEGHAHPHRVIVMGPDEGDLLWRNPASETELGGGAALRIYIDHGTAPDASMTVMTERLAATGIPVHLHEFEDEILYVLSGTGTAIAGEGREEVPLEPGSVVYIPRGEWHGAINSDPAVPMKIFIVTTPSGEGGLSDFFRRISVKPGHPPLNLPREEFVALFEQYGMRIPAE
jgi:mannose-6-phosphate isomerase-like protein (cupin superfamily)